MSLMPSFRDIWDETLFLVKTRGPWWATSVVAHAVILSGILLVLGTVAGPSQKGEAPAFESVSTELPEETVESFDLGEAPLEPTVLDTNALTLEEAPQMAQDAQDNGNDLPFEEAGGGTSSGAENALGGLGGFDVIAKGPGSKVTGPGGLTSGIGTGTKGGSGGAGEGFGGRGQGRRKAMLASGGGTKGSERAVAAALNWLARHQNRDGSWSLGEFSRNCNNKPSCDGKGDISSDAAATAMALLPFFAAGQTHLSKGPYKKNIHAGLYWLAQKQKSNGDLSADAGQKMYTHGLCAICVCEAYGLSRDKQIGAVAQRAIDFIEMAQHKGGGGWRYNPGEAGDTSVVGWQVMALKSGLMAGLRVSSPVVQGAHNFLKSVSSGKGGMFAYTSDAGPTPTMTAVGLLCTQYLGAERKDPAIVEGSAYIMTQQPDVGARNIYYWYYATQVMHNLPGYDWDVWNRKMRKILIDTQEKTGCATGSWSPSKPTADGMGAAGGRIMMTSLSCLTLEVYYRYLPLYKLDGAVAAAKPAAALPAEKK